MHRVEIRRAAYRSDGGGAVPQSAVRDRPARRGGAETVSKGYKRDILRSGDGEFLT